MADRTNRLVTPEAVVLEVEAAGIASRLLAALIDVFVLGVVLQALAAVFSIGGAAVDTSVSGDGLGILLGVLAAITFFAVLVGWAATIEMLSKGRSLGKMALGLRVVTVEGAPIRLRHALIRGLVGVVELFFTFGVVALVVALSSHRFRRLGDHLAGTVVVRDRAGSTQANAMRFAPEPTWEPWVRRLDTSRLRTEDYRLVRSFLLRAGELDPEVRADLGARILAAVAPRLGIPAHQLGGAVAWGPVPPLLAVAAAYQRRFDPAPVWVTPSPAAA